LHRFRDEAMNIAHNGVTSTVEGLSGWRCGACGDILFDADSAKRYAAAGDALVLRDREHQRSEIRRIRRKLGLSQAQASELTGGGPNAFSRYELGKANPMPAVVNLLRLLDKHPELLRELTKRPRPFSESAPQRPSPRA
jgi:HTH-type transcriptional regulator/antitoxin MqsA